MVGRLVKFSSLDDPLLFGLAALFEDRVAAVERIAHESPRRLYPNAGRARK